MTDGVGRFCAIERIEVKLSYPFAAQLLRLLNRHRRGYQSRRLALLLQTLESSRQPDWYTRPTTLRKLLNMRQARHWQNSRHDRQVNPGGHTPIPESKEGVIIKEELRYRAARTGRSLLFEHIQIRLRASRLWMDFWISGHRHVEISNTDQCPHKLCRTTKSFTIVQYFL